MDSFEYVITAGEGTLIEFGVIQDWEVLNMVESLAYEDLLIAPCDDDCETGQ
jgi:hypothetical protein